jgi:hypothetical protein
MKRLMALLVCFSISSTWCGEALDQWGESARPAGAGAPISVTFGDGIFVAAGKQGTILTSSNGVDWAGRDSTITTDITRVKFVNNKFFAFSVNSDPRNFSSVTLVSSDGVEWDRVSDSITGQTTDRLALADITYASGLYYGARLWVGPFPPGGLVFTSPDLVQWSPLGNAVLNDLTFGGGVFVGRYSNGHIYSPVLSYSDDARNWTTVPDSYSTPYDGEITYQEGSFYTVRLYQIWPGGFPQVGVPVDGFILSASHDGKTWDKLFNLAGGNFTPLKAGVAGGFFVFPAGASLYYTTNAVSQAYAPTTNWTRVDFNISNPETGNSDVAFGNNVFVDVSFGKIFVSNPISGIAPLRLLAQPQAQSVNVGGTVSFSVLAQGSDPISYQWRLNGTNIAAATNRLLTITNITVDQAGEYDVVVTSPGGTVTSDKAVVKVQFADVHFYAGVTLRGNPSDKFLLEYQDQLEPSDQWHDVANVTLTNQQSIWFDADSVAHPNRFYRATFLGP